MAAREDPLRPNLRLVGTKRGHAEEDGVEDSAAVGGGAGSGRRRRQTLVLWAHAQTCVVRALPWTSVLTIASISPFLYAM